MDIFKNIYKYREFLRTNIKKEIRGKYKKSFFGVMWSFLNPLLQLLVYAIIFPIILKTTQENYVIFLCVALIPWTYFTTTITQSASTMVVNGNIIKKVYFPREILPISIVTSGAYNFLIATLIIVAFLFFYKVGLTVYVVFYPIVLIVQYLLLLGISFILSSITVYFRDIEHFIGIVLMVLFYGTPIVYASNTFPENIRWILNLNPMTHIINGYRDIFYYQTIPDFKMLGLLFIFTIILCIAGYLIFNKLQKKFAEEL